MANTHNERYVVENENLNENEDDNKQKCLFLESMEMVINANGFK